MVGNAMRGWTRQVRHLQGLVSRGADDVGVNRASLLRGDDEFHTACYWARRRVRTQGTRDTIASGCAIPVLIPDQLRLILWAEGAVAAHDLVCVGGDGVVRARENPIPLHATGRGSLP